MHFSVLESDFSATQLTNTYYAQISIRRDSSIFHKQTDMEKGIYSPSFYFGNEHLEYELSPLALFITTFVHYSQSNCEMCAKVFVT